MKIIKNFIVKNRLSEFPELAGFLAIFGREHQLTDELVFDITLALEEIFSNIVFYSYADNNEHRIEIHIGLQDDEIILEIRDDGTPFNPLEAPKPDIRRPFSEREPGGLGIFLVHNLMDALDYRTDQGKNILVLKKTARYADLEAS
ncbi:ATP-binding protein [Desulfonema ishimotonii]|nr:ATP-binding protein [Desulfonema ishimotonii]